MTVHPPTDLLTPAERGARTVTYGPWEIALRGAELDDIRYHGRAVLRSIRAVTRDRDWNTLPVTVLDVAEDGGNLTVTARHGVEGQPVFDSVLTARMGEDTLSVEVELRALRDFLSNRTGLIMLHQPALAGSELLVGHGAGEPTRTRFPAAISPHQPAFNIASLAWDHAGVAVTAEFSGAVFEMEDQRNWTDASFKTYSTPLAEPFPVAIAAGSVIRHGVRVACAVSGDVVAPAAVTAIIVDPAGRLAPLPEIGVGVSTAADTGRTAHPGLPEGIRTLLVEIDPSREQWLAGIERAREESRAGGPAGPLGLDLRILVGEGSEIGPVLDAVAELKVRRLAVFDRASLLATPGLVSALRAELAARGDSPAVIGGTRSHFTELNRGSTEIEPRGPVALSLIPFMHERSGHQLVESLGVQATVLENTRALVPHRALHIGPITLGARFNAVATAPAASEHASPAAAAFGTDLVPGSTDPRQHAVSLGAWTLGSIAALAGEDVASLSYFESRGPRGIHDPDAALSGAGRALALAAGLTGLTRLAAQVPAGLVALAAEGLDGGVELLIGNLSEARVGTRIEVLGGRHEDAALPVSLAPGELAQIRISRLPR